MNYTFILVYMYYVMERAYGSDYLKWVIAAFGTIDT